MNGLESGKEPGYILQGSRHLTLQEQTWLETTKRQGSFYKLC